MLLLTLCGGFVMVVGFGLRSALNWVCGGVYFGFVFWCLDVLNLGGVYCRLIWGLGVCVCVWGVWCIV